MSWYEFSIKSQGCQNESRPNCRYSTWEDLRIPFLRLEVIGSVIHIPKSTWLNISLTSTVLAFPAIHHGHVQVELYDHSRFVIIPAHETLKVRFHFLWMDQGWHLHQRRKHLFEYLTRYQAIWSKSWDEEWIEQWFIVCLCFNPTNTLIACSSDKGTVHIFSLLPDTNPTTDECSE